MKQFLQSVLSNELGTDSTLVSYGSISGGSINDAYSIACDETTYFIKVNDATAYPQMFEAEARGLSLLASATELTIPKVIATGRLDNQSYILMEIISKGQIASDFWTKFGTGLAMLHRQTGENFGLDHDNYIGSLPQSNKSCASWSEFFINERLEPLIAEARNQGEIKSETVRKFDKLFVHLNDFFPKEPPSLLHGDLWSGNFMVDKEGNPALIDPAVYYGHREMDLGMSTLFGGFDPSFYHAYNETWPMEQGWEDRIEVANLYPLLVHVVLFGGSYVQSVEHILRRMT